MDIMDKIRVEIIEHEDGHRYFSVYPQPLGHESEDEARDHIFHDSGGTERLIRFVEIEPPQAGQSSFSEIEQGHLTIWTLLGHQGFQEAFERILTAVCEKI